MTFDDFKSPTELDTDEGLGDSDFCPKCGEDVAFCECSDLLDEEDD